MPAHTNATQLATQGLMGGVLSVTAFIAAAPRMGAAVSGRLRQVIRLPFVVLLEQHRADEVRHAVLDRKYTDNLGSALRLLVKTLD